MKNLYLLLSFCLLIIGHSFAQGPQLQWQKSLGGSNIENASSVVKTGDGYIVAGDSKSIDGDIVQNLGNTDAYITKLNLNGEIVWTKNYGGSQFDSAKCIRQTSDGGYIVAGYTTSSDVNINRGHEDLWVFKIDAEGELEWQKTYGGSLSETAASIDVTATGGFIVIGYTSSEDGDINNQHGVEDLWVLNLDSTGNIIWQKCYGGTSMDRGKDIMQTFDGGFIFVGDVQSLPSGDITNLIGAVDIWVVKIDNNGDIEWQKSFGGNYYQRAEGIEQTADGGYVIGGETASVDGDVHNNHPITSAGHADFWVFKIDNTGTIQWETTFGGSAHENAFCFKKCSDNSYLIGGYTFSNDDDVAQLYGVSDCWLAKVDDNGTLLWNKTYGGTQYDQVLGFDETSDNGYILACTSYSNDVDVTGNHGNSDLWVVRLQSEMLSNPDFNQPNFALYPNPVNNILYVQTQQISIDGVIYDSLGRKILETTEKNIDVSHLPSGMYILKMTNNLQGSSHRFIKE